MSKIKADCNGPVFFSFVLSVGKPHGRSPWIISEPFKTAKEAIHWGKAVVRDGKGTFAFVVESGIGPKKILDDFTYPSSAANAIARHAELMEMLANEK